MEGILVYIPVKYKSTYLYDIVDYHNQFFVIIHFKIE